MKIWRTWFFVIAFALAAGDGDGFAAQEEKGSSESAVTLEEVVITATRDTEEIRKVPARVTVITEDDIRKSGAANIVELLDKLEGIQFRSFSGNPAQSFIDIRGFGGDTPFGKTLVMLDGRRLNRPDWSSINWMQIPLSNIERIEIVRGPGSVLYGDAAIGGVINVLTKKGKGKPQVDVSFTAGSYGLHDEQVGVSGAADKWSYALNGENHFSFGYRDRSKYSSRNAGFDAGYAANDRLNLSLGLSFNKTDFQMPGALTKAQMEQDRRQYQPATPANWTNAAPDDDGADAYTNVNLGATSLLGSLGRFDVNLLYGRKQIENNMPSFTFNRFSDTDVETYGLTPKYVLEKEIFGFKNKLTLGADWYHEPYEKTFFGTRERTTKNSVADLSRDSFGSYLRDEFHLFDPLILSLGFRQDRTVQKGKNSDFTTPANNFDDEKIHQAEAHEAGLTYLFGKASSVYAKYASVYRIPFIDEQASFNGWGGGFNRDLEKETGKSMEVGAQISPSADLKMGLSLFRIDMEDEIAWDAVANKNRNMDKTRHEGAEMSASYRLVDWAKIYGNFTYHRATFEAGQYNTKEVPLVPDRIANAGMELDLPFSLVLRPEARYVAACFLSGDFDNNTDKVESYTLYNLYLFYRPQTGKWRLSAFLGVENLFDKKYVNFGTDNVSWGGENTYYPAPGLTWRGGVSLTF
jgi:iron complex outermembrane receptor protein